MSIYKTGETASANRYYAAGSVLEWFSMRSLLIIAFIIQSAFCASTVVAAVTPAATRAKTPNLAIYYQGRLPVEELQAFDVVVIDPARSKVPDRADAPNTAWLARLNVRGASTEAQIARLLEVDIPNLLRVGFRGFLLDDGAPIENVTNSDTAAALVVLIDGIRRLDPSAKILVRNHLVVARMRPDALMGVVVESLFHRPGGFHGMMSQVPDATRAPLLQEIKSLQAESGLPVFAVDYCPAADKGCRRQLARTISGHGLQPYVSAPGMGLIGMGQIEVMPRKVLMVQALPWNVELEQSLGVLAMSMPLNYLGYDIRYLDLTKEPLPADIHSDRYAGIVVALTHTAPRSAEWRQWLLAHVRKGIKVAVIGHFGFPIDGATASFLQLEGVPGKLPASGTAEILKQSPWMGFEAMPRADLRDAVGIRAPREQDALLRLNAGGFIYDAAALTEWGGYVLSPYGVVSQDAVTQYRWTVQPLEFFKRALQLPEMPVPDVTSENGRRLMFTHVDGDGFVSRTEFSSAPDQFSAQVLHDRIVKRYPIPMTLSVIEGEVGPAGLYPQYSPQLEAMARKLFALPNVEMASHTYTHPFFWDQIDKVTGKRVKPYHQTPAEAADPFALDIRGYETDLDREIKGSIDYINQRLAPPGKKVVAMLWSGNAQAPAIALRKAAAEGVLNMNGGSTVITRSKDSWINIAPYGVAKGERPDEFQVYAATMNENVYTNDWLGPFYGFSRVLETFEMTDRPIRFKAVNIYYHFYSATKKASLRALEEIFNAVLKQPVFPIYSTEYIRRVHQWRRVAIAREGDRWLVRSGADLRQLRWPGAQVPELQSAEGLIGYQPAPDGTYIHMSGESASFRMAPVPSSGQPYVREASGFIRNASREGPNLQFEIGGYYKPFVELAGMAGCKPVGGQGVRSARIDPNTWRLDWAGNPSQPVAYQTIRVHCEQR